MLNSIFDLSTCEVEKYKPSNRVPFWQEDDPETFVDNEGFQQPATKLLKIRLNCKATFMYLAYFNSIGVQGPKILFFFWEVKEGILKTLV